MNKIRDNIYLGSWQPATDLPLLQANGITAILNVALEQQDPDFFNEGISNVKVGLGDCDYNKSHMKDLAVLALERLLIAGEKVYVHCVAGASRSPYVVAKYLAKVEGSNLRDKTMELHTLRPEVFPQSPLYDE